MASAHSQQPSRFLGSRASKVVLLVVSVLSLEVAARLAYTFTVTDTSADWFALDRDVGWIRRPDFEGPGEGGSPRRFDGKGLLATDARQIVESDRPRVVFVGDSITYGYGVETPLTFVERLDAALPAIDAINLGVPGYTSIQGYETVVRDAIPLEPVLIVFGFNYNDRRYVLRAANVDGPPRFSRQYLAHKLRHVFLYRGLRRVLMDWTAPSAALRLDHMPSRVEPDRYRLVLEKVAALTKTHHVDLLFLMFGDNPARTHDLDRGMARLRSGDLDAAIQDLQSAVFRDDDFSDIARLHLAAAYRKAGRAGDADAVLALARPVVSLHGGRPLYTDALYHDIMRGVAHRLDVPLMDATESLDPDPSQYLDSVHLSTNGHDAVAGLLTHRIAKWVDEHRFTGAAGVGNDMTDPLPLRLQALDQRR